LVVASLEETRGLLPRFDRVYSGYRYITQGCPWGALARRVALSLRARCFFFPTHVVAHECTSVTYRDVTR
jgi:hypothetical protein